MNQKTMFLNNINKGDNIIDQFKFDALQCMRSNIH